MLLLLQYTLIFSSVLTLVALGGCYSEHSGVINLGLEGIMVIGALGGALVMRFLPAGTPGILVVLLTLLSLVLSIPRFWRSPVSISKQIRLSSVPPLTYWVLHWRPFSSKLLT